MKRYIAVAASLALLAPAILPSHAAEMKMDAPKAAAVQVHKGQGKVNSVDAKANKINLSHGPIATLKWPGMTMDFQVRDAAVLKGVTPGQNIEFDVAQQGGQFVITRIAPAAKK